MGHRLEIGEKLFSLFLRSIPLFREEATTKKMDVDGKHNIFPLLIKEEGGITNGIYLDRQLCRYPEMMPSRES